MFQFFVPGLRNRPRHKLSQNRAALAARPGLDLVCILLVMRALLENGNYDRPYERIDVGLANGLAESMGINSRLTLVEVVSDVTAQHIERDPEIREGE